MKLIEGQKYTLTFEWGTVTCYYAGYFKDSNFTCDHCYRELWSVHEFLEPTNNDISYKDCCEGKYNTVIHLGTTCIKKMKIEKC